MTSRRAKAEGKPWKFKKVWVVKDPKPKRMPRPRKPKVVKNPDYYVVRDTLGRVLEERSYRSQSSQRHPVTNRLVLTPQPYFARRFKAQFNDQTYVNCSGFESGLMPNILGDMYVDTTRAYNGAYGALQKGLHCGDASLGITLAQFDKTASMLSTRMRQFNTFLKGVTTRRGAKRLRREFSRYIKDAGYAGQKHAVRTANAHLEYIFGWKPLVTDIISSIGVLSNERNVGGYLTGRGRSFEETSTVVNNGYVSEKTDVSAIVRCGLSAKFKVESPTKWDDNRLGLADPNIVLWDLIPWSFVVGMFGNVNQVIRSYRSTYGLTVSDISITYSVRGFIEKKATFKHWLYPTLTAPSTASCSFKTKTRVLAGTIPTPKLVWRIPPLTVDTLLMASALTVQQLTRIGKLIK